MQNEDDLCEEARRLDPTESSTSALTGSYWKQNQCSHAANPRGCLAAWPLVVHPWQRSQRPRTAAATNERCPGQPGAVLRRLLR